MADPTSSSVKLTNPRYFNIVDSNLIRTKGNPAVCVRWH